MALQIADFWKLVAESGLLPPAEIQRWTDAFGQLKGAAKQGNAATLCQWLISEKAITKYHGTILMAGRPGPFIYGEYKVLDRLTTGRFKGLFRAVHQPTGHPVLLSFLSGPLTQNPQALALAQQQVQFTRQLTSPNLSRCYQMVDLGAFKFVACELLTGETLEDRLSKGPLSPLEAIRIARQVALALAKLQEAGAPHTEVMPANIWLPPQGGVKLLQLPFTRDPLMPWGPIDFAALEANGRIESVAEYLAPELAQPGQMPDTTSDIYALGCVLYQMIAGRAPFAGGDWRQRIMRHASEAIQPINGQGVPPQLPQVVAYMMAKDPNVRYRQAGQVAEALGFFLDPAKLNPPAEVTSPVQALYEASIRSVAVAVAPPQTAPAADFAPAPIAVAQPYAPLPVPGAVPVGYGTPMPRGVQPKKGGNLMLLIAVGGGVVAILAAVVIFGMGGGGKQTPPGPNVAINTPSVPSKTPGTNTTVTPPNTEKKNPPPADPKPPTNDGNNTGSGTNTGGNPKTGTEPKTGPKSQPAEVDDDGQSLWVSPTTGKPIELRYVANDAQVLIILRPAELISHAYGERLWASLGPGGEYLRNQVLAITGAKFNDIQQLTVGLYDRPGAAPEVSLAVRLKSRYERAQMVKAWGDPAEQDYNGQKFYQGSAWSYYLPPSDNDLTIVVAEAERLKRIIDNGSKPPAIDIKLERMLLDSDAARQFTMVFSPSYLTSDGKASIFRGLFAPLQAPVEELLGMNARAGMLSIHLGNNFFWEVRLTGDGTDPGMLARALNERIAKLSKDVRNVVTDMNLHPYAKRVVSLLPDALGKMADFTRAGMDNEQAVVRCLLPVNAGQHLFLGAELLLAHKAGPATGTGPATAGGDSVKDKLGKKISLVFTRDTLEKSMQMMSDMVGVPIEILGKDLELEGITKNQSFGMNENDMPARDILMKIMKQANPDGKLIYVIKPKEKGGPEMIFITTRAGAEKRKDAIPPELAAPKK